MGLRAKLAIVLSAVLVLIMGVATILHLQSVDEELNAELERRAGIFSRVVADQVEDTIGASGRTLTHMQAQTERIGRVPWIAWAAVYSGDPGHPAVVHTDRDQVHRPPEAAVLDAVQSALHGEARAALEHAAPDGLILLRRASRAGSSTERPARAVAVLKLRGPDVGVEGRAAADAMLEALAGGAAQILLRGDGAQAEVQAICERFANLDDVAAIEVFGRDGRVTAHSRPERIGNEPSKAHRAYIEALFSRGGTRTEYSREQGRYNRFVAVPTGTDAGEGGRLAVVEVAMDTGPIRAQVADSGRRSLLTLLLVLGVAWVAIFLAAGQFVLKPLRKLSDATRIVAAGDFDHALDTSGRDETGQLAGHFQAMVAALRETTVSRDFMERVLDSMSTALIITDPDDRILRVNQAAVGLTRHDENTLKGRALADILERAEDPGSGEGNAQVGSIRTADLETVPVLYSRGSMAAPHGEDRGSVWVLKDMSERVRVQEELASSERALERAQRVEAIGRLAGGVAHDLNNVLAAIIGHADLLLMALQPGMAQRENAQEILKASERAAALTGQLLAFGRRQVLNPRILKLNDVIEDLLGMLRRLAGQSVEVVLQVTPDLVPVRLDPVRIEQVLVNLVVNARDAMPEGGRITIETRNVDVSADAAQAQELDSAGLHALVAIWDTGVGMDEETQAHMFEPFFTTKTADTGTGLGLSTAFGIVKQSGGTITCLSQPGEGTRFALLFPACADDAEANDGPGEIDESMIRHSRVLLVDDEPSVRAFCRRYLESCGYEVLEAVDGETGLDLLDRDTEAIDLVVADIVLPGMPGTSMVKAMRGLRPGLKAIFMSGVAPAHLDANAIDGPFLQKPFTGHQLVRAVQVHLDAD